MTAADHTPDLRHFWQRLQTGVAVAVATPSPDGSPTSDKLLGVRDGVLRYFRDGLGREISVAVVPQADHESPVGLLGSDVEVLALARAQIARLAERLGDAYHLYVASEGGLQGVEIDGRMRWFLRSWVALRSPVGEACGGSGAIELPERLVSGLAEDQVPFAIPGTRRGGGMMRSLTGGLEDRRRATALATSNALATLFYGILEARPGRRRA